MLLRCKAAAPLFNVLSRVLISNRPNQVSNVIYLRPADDGSHSPEAAEKADKAFDAWIIALAKRMATHDHAASLA